MNIETLLESALRESTSEVPLDPHARQAIADRLAEPRPAAHRQWVLPAVAAAVVVAVAVAGVVLAGAGNNQHATIGSAGDVAGHLPGYAIPPSRYFIAFDHTDAAKPQMIEKIVRASDGAVVGTLPNVGTQFLVEPQLSPDGTRVYALWHSDTRLGYVDLITGKRTLLTQRRGEMGSPTISADGSTLAYQWTPRLDGNDVSDVVVRDLASGRERVLTHAPSGPTLIPLALSPNGRRLALVPTTGAPRRRPLWIVRTAAHQPFAHPHKVMPVGCATGAADEPRWTSQGLYAVWHCTTDRTREVSSSDLATVDPQRGRVESSHHLAPTSAFLELAVLPRRSGPLFVTSDIGTPADARVVIRDSSQHWASRVVAGVNQLSS